MKLIILIICIVSSFAIELEKFEGSYLYRINAKNDEHKKKCCDKLLTLCGNKISMKKENDFLKIETMTGSFLCKEMKGEGKATIECAQLKSNPVLYLNIDENLRVYSPQEIGSKETQEKLCDSRLIKLDETAAPADTGESMVGSEDVKKEGGKKNLMSTIMSANKPNTSQKVASHEISTRYHSEHHTAPLIVSPSVPFHEAINPHPSPKQTPEQLKMDASHIMDIVRDYSKFSNSHPRELTSAIGAKLHKSINILRRARRI